MHRHLDDTSFAELLAGSGSASAWTHLRACPTCARELERLRRAVGGLRARLDARARQAERFSEVAEERLVGLLRAQAAGELGPERARRAGAWRRWAMAAAAVVLVVVVHGWRDTRSIRPPLSASVAPAVSDAALLAAVEDGVSRRLADALAPLDALAQELAAPPAAGSSADEGPS